MGAEAARHARAPGAEPFHPDVDHGRGVEVEDLAHDEAADDRDAERLPQFRAVAVTQGQGHRTEQGRHGGHHDRAETQQAGPVDRVLRARPGPALVLDREIDHEDGVLLHDADEQDDADERHDREIGARDEQGQDRAAAGRGQRGDDRERMDEALVQDAEHEIDGHQGGQDQEGLVGEGGLEGLRRALETAVDGGGDADPLQGGLDGAGGGGERGARGEIEGHGRARRTGPDG